MDNLFPENWGLQNVNDLSDEGLNIPNPMDQTHKLQNYLSPYVRDFEFTHIASWEIADNYFYGLFPNKIGKNLEWIKEPECKTKIEPKTLWIYKERNGEKGYQPDQDELLYTIKIFISTNHAKLKKLYGFTEDTVKDNEILFFMEDNTGDLSDQSLYVRFGKNVDKVFLLKMSDRNLGLIAENMPDFDKNKLRELISTGEVKTTITALRKLLDVALNLSLLSSTMAKALGWASEQIGNAVEKLMVPESIWDSRSDEYFLKKENVLEALKLDTDFLKAWQDSIEESPKMKPLLLLVPSELFVIVREMAEWYNRQIEGVVNSIYLFFGESIEQLANITYLTERIAFLCGLWNGLVDFVAGIFKFLGVLLQAPYDIAQNFQSVLEAIDDFREAWAAFSFADFFEAAWRLKEDMWVELQLFFTDPNPRESYNFDRIAYFAGFGTAFVASFFIPLANISRVSAIAKHSKFIPEEFVTALNITRTQGVKGFKAMVKLLEDIAGFLGKKGNEMYQELRKLLDKMLEWIKSNRKRFEKTGGIKALKHLDDFKALRPKFQDSKLVARLWKRKIKTERLFPNKLRKLYTEYLKDYPNLSKGFNQAQFKTIIKKRGKVIDEIEEFSVSGRKSKLIDNFGDPPSLPPNTINVLDDYATFEKFVEGAVDFGNRPRKYDSEIKYIFNFLKNHIDKGDEFIIETSNIFKTCGSCEREFVMLESYLTSLGKKVKIKVRTDETIKGTARLKEKSNNYGNNIFKKDS